MKRPIPPIEPKRLVLSVYPSGSLESILNKVQNVAKNQGFDGELTYSDVNLIDSHSCYLNFMLTLDHPWERERQRKYKEDLLQYEKDLKRFNLQEHQKLYSEIEGLL